MPPPDITAAAGVAASLTASPVVSQVRVKLIAPTDTFAIALVAAAFVAAALVAVTLVAAALIAAAFVDAAFVDAAFVAAALCFAVAFVAAAFVAAALVAAAFVAAAFVAAAFVAAAFVAAAFVDAALVAAVCGLPFLHGSFWSCYFCRCRCYNSSPARSGSCPPLLSSSLLLALQGLFLLTALASGAAGATFSSRLSVILA